MAKKKPSEVEERLLDIDEACRMLSSSRTLLYALMERGELRYTRIGRTRRIPLSAVRELIEKNMVGGAK